MIGSWRLDSRAVTKGFRRRMLRLRRRVGSRQLRREQTGGPYGYSRSPGRASSCAPALLALVGAQGKTTAVAMSAGGRVAPTRHAPPRRAAVDSPRWAVDESGHAKRVPPCRRHKHSLLGSRQSVARSPCGSLSNIGGRSRRGDFAAHDHSVEAALGAAKPRGPWLRLRSHRCRAVIDDGIAGIYPRQCGGTLARQSRETTTGIGSKRTCNTRPRDLCGYVGAQ